MLPIEGQPQLSETVYPPATGGVNTPDKHRLGHVSAPPRARSVNVARANDRTLEFFIVPFLREWLYRQGGSVDAVSNDELLARVRHTFVDSRAPKR